MINEFDISEYLKSNGFEKVTDDRTFYLKSPRVKVKLIYPDPTFLCGYQRMVVSSPDRVFAKQELDIPKSRMDAAKVIMPLLNHRPMRDTSLKNIWETQAEVLNISEYNFRTFVSVQVPGASYPIETFVRPSLSHILEGVVVGNWVHMVLKIDGRKVGGKRMNTIEVIGINVV